MLIEGLRIESSDKEPIHGDEGIPRILAGTNAVIRLFGQGFTNDTVITFTDVLAERGAICDKIKTKEFPVSIAHVLLKDKNEMRENKGNGQNKKTRSDR